MTVLKLPVDLDHHRNVWFCLCGRRLTRGEFLEMKHIAKLVHGRTKHVNQLVVKDDLKQCHYCERGLKK